MLKFSRHLARDHAECCDKAKEYRRLQLRIAQIFRAPSIDHSSNKPLPWPPSFHHHDLGGLLVHASGASWGGSACCNPLKSLVPTIISTIDWQRPEIVVSTARDVIRKKAREAHARQQLLIAEQHYRTLLKEDPVIDDVINLGALLRSQGRLQEGSLFYQKWVSKFSKDPRLILNACNCWNESNDALISISYLEEYICKQKVERKILICYSDALNRLGRLKESNEVLHKCIANNPEDKEIWIRIGLTHAKARQPKNALEAFNRANTIDPEDLEVTSNRITLLKDLGRLSEAESLINKLSAKNQQNVDIAQATAGLF